MPSNYFILCRPFLLPPLKAHRLGGRRRGRMALNLAQASLPPGGWVPVMGWGRAGGGRPSPLGTLPLVCTIGFRSAEGGEIELPDSESVCGYACVLCVCVCVCVCVCLSVCLSPPGPQVAEGRDRGSALMRQYQRGTPSSCLHPLTSPTLVPFWGPNG